MSNYGDAYRGTSRLKTATGLSRISNATSPEIPRRISDEPTTGKTKTGRNGISGFVQNILNSKKKTTAQLKRGNNLPTIRQQGNDSSGRRPSPHSQSALSDQNVECMVYYEPHDLNTSLSSGSERGSHAGSASGSGSSGHVTRRKLKQTGNEPFAGKRDNYDARRTENNGPVPSSLNMPTSPLASTSRTSIYAHGDYGASHNTGNQSHIPHNPAVQSGPAYTNIKPTYQNPSTGNYLPMDQHLNKDSGVGSSVSGSFRQEENSLGFEDSGIDIGTTNFHQQAGYTGSRASAYSQDEYLLPLSHRGGNQATEEQLRIQQLQLQKQELQLKMLQKQHIQIQQHLQRQSQQTPHQMLKQNHAPYQEKSDENVNIAHTQKDDVNSKDTESGPNISGSNGIHSHNSAIVHKTSSELQTHRSEVPMSNGNYGTKPRAKHRTRELMASHGFNPSSYISAKDEKLILSQKSKLQGKDIGNVSNTSRIEKQFKLHSARRHTFAPQEGYTEGTARSSIRSSVSTSSKASSSQGRVNPHVDSNRPAAANIVLNIPGYRVSGSMGRNKRISSAEESDMESMTSVSVTSREVANIMTQAMRMHRNSNRGRSKGQCEHHHRTFTSKPGRTLSRSSNHRSSTSSNRSKGKRACTRCGSQGVVKPEKNSENLISFIEQSMRSFLLNSSETVSTEDDVASSETKSSSEKNSEKDGFTRNSEDPDIPDSSTSTSQKPTSNQSSKSLTPSLFDIASHCELHAIEIPNDRSNTLGYGLHLQQVEFNPTGFMQNLRFASGIGAQLGQGSSAFDRFQGKQKLIYCIHMLDGAGIAAKHGSLKEGDYLIEVNEVNCLEQSDEALLDVLSQETDSLRLLIARGHQQQTQEFFA